MFGSVGQASGTGFSLFASNFCGVGKVRNKQAEQAAQKVGRFVGRGFSHDVRALDSSGVLTPEARKWHFSVACSACLHSDFAVWAMFETNRLKPVPLRLWLGQDF
jgi:hypothetical protein